nr:MAG TPA: hypothetical protein [Caudoviricetes sp.]
MKNQEFQNAADEFANGISQYLDSVAEHLCEVSQMSRMSVGDLLLSLAVRVKLVGLKKENDDVAVSEKAI